MYTAGAQAIPGRVELAWYDMGGEGVAYHDSTPENLGAKLNHEVHDYGSHRYTGIAAYTAFFREMKADIFRIQKTGPILTSPTKWPPG